MEERIKATIKMDPVDIPKTTTSTMMSTIKISKYINALMRKTFKDYLGCKVYPVLNDPYSMRHPVRCDLYFTFGSDNFAGSTVAAFKSVADPVKAKAGSAIDYTAMINAHNAKLKNLNSAEITQDAIDMLHPLLWSELAAQTKETSSDYQKKGIVKEQATPMAYNVNSEVITPVISFIDVNAIFALFAHGEVADEKGRKYDDFMITPVRSIISMNPQQAMYQSNPGENYLYNISQLDKDELNDLMNEIGYINKTGYADCYTESY